VEKYFVPVHITIEEHDEKKSLNTPGGDVLLKRLEGDPGLPFFAFVDRDNHMLVNSMEPPSGNNKGGNIGHPFQPHEVDWFMMMLSKGAPSMTGDERQTIEKYLRAQKK
jgi:hypothetical protein